MKGTKWVLLALGLILTIAGLYLLNRKNQSLEPQPLVKTEASGQPLLSEDLKKPGTSPSEKLVSKSSSTTEKSLLSFLNDRGRGEWQLKRDVSGKIEQISGGTLAGVGENLESALRFAKELAPYLGVKPEQVVNPQDGSEQSTTPYSVIYRFKQKVSGYSVHGSDLSIFSSSKDHSANLMNLSLKEVEGLNPKPTYSAQEVRSVLEEEFPKENQSSIRVDREPVIWAESTPAELAWIYRIKIEQPVAAHWVVLVGAQTKKILSKQDSLVQ